MATLDQVIAQMIAADMPPLPPGHPIADGKIHRFGGREKKCWYVLYDVPTRNGRRVLTGAFGRWQGTDNGKIAIKADWTGVEPDEYQRFQRSQTAMEARERAKRAERARFAGNRALEQWRAARARLAEGETVPYLARKRLQWENGLRVYTDGTLLVPMVRYDVTEEQEADPAYTGPRRLAGVQKIFPKRLPNGQDKLFNRGADPRGVACRFGKKPKDGDLILIAEGLATALSPHQALERAYATYVAFVAGNLEAVGRLVRAECPKSPVLFLADDDAYLEAQLNKRLRTEYGVHALYKVLDGERTFDSKFGPLTVRADLHEGPDGAVLTAGITVRGALRTLVLRNTGRAKARAAAQAIGNSWVAYPRFKAREVSIDPDAPRLTDWNDLHIAEGIEAVLDQVSAEIRSIEDAREIAASLASGAPPPAEGGAGEGGKGGGGDEPDWRLHFNLIRRFTLVERSGQAWDEERGFLWRVEHMRLSFGVKAVNAWLGSSRRRAVDLSQVVFDPCGKEDPKATVNIFRGLKMKPKAGSCELTLKLLRYLCGEEESTHAPVSDWVEKWCAFQVQHVGAKMKTAIVMHGPEGTGKNLLWSAMLRIFAPYSALIGQGELEAKFNTWQSGKLMIVANEVVTRAEMAHHVGRLKNLVTEDVLPIEGKFSDMRYEANHINLVFLSNEFQPLKISPGDRRYMVIRTPTALDGKFYKAVADELANGGVEAFMHRLSEIELGEFNEHTKPITTDAKRDLVEVGMLPSQLFWQEIKEGIVPLPYCPCLTDDLYRAYTIWAARRGHKQPEAQNRFTPAFMSMNGVRRGEPRVPDPENLRQLADVKKDWKKRRVFYMGPRRVIHHFGADRPTEYASDDDWVLAGIKEFRIALRAYEAEGAPGYSSGSAQAPRQQAL